MSDYYCKHCHIDSRTRSIHPCSSSPTGFCEWNRLKGMFDDYTDMVQPYFVNICACGVALYGVYNCFPDITNMIFNGFGGWLAGYALGYILMGLSIVLFWIALIVTVLYCLACLIT
jgi:hypothetical protein